jgi:hypothetical protein
MVKHNASAVEKSRVMTVPPPTLLDLPRAEVATDTGVLRFIDRQGLFGRGVGYVDVRSLD